MTAERVTLRISSSSVAAITSSAPWASLRSGGFIHVGFSRSGFLLGGCILPGGFRGFQIEFRFWHWNLFALFGCLRNESFFVSRGCLIRRHAQRHNADAQKQCQQERQHRFMMILRFSDRVKQPMLFYIIMCQSVNPIPAKSVFCIGKIAKIPIHLLPNSFIL